MGKEVRVVRGWGARKGKGRKELVQALLPWGFPLGSVIREVDVIMRRESQFHNRASNQWQNLCVVEFLLSDPPT